MSWKSTKAEGRNQAIWFDSKSDNWGIGALEKIGSNNFQIKAEAKCGENHPCDLANNCWLYLKSNGHEWKDPRGSTDIEFRKLHEGKKNIFLNPIPYGLWNIHCYMGGPWKNACLCKKSYFFMLNSNST